MSSKYRKKPVEVEAILFTGTPSNIEEIREFVGRDHHVDAVGVDIITLEGVMSADVGDYIIKGVEGEVYPCKPSIFAKTYEPA